MTAPTQRFTALDVFRGLTICLMIVVNTPGDGAFTFAPLQHAKWHGFTPTDLVFPSFLFAVGNALGFVSRRWASQPRAQVLRKIFTRSLLIFLLGFLMYWFPFVREGESGWVFLPLSHTRILGVLQRIALCYAAASLLVYFCNKRTVIATGILLLLLYWGICIVAGDTDDPYAITTNAGYRLDIWLMGPDHLHHGEGIPFDPEGWLSTLPAIVNVLAGYLASLYLQTESGRAALLRMIAAGVFLVTIAWCWNFVIPVNKKLWTSSFVLLTVGLDCIILAVIVFLVQRRPGERWQWFFEVAGRNPLAIYLFSELLATVLYTFHAGDESLFFWLYQHSFAILGPYWGSLGFALAFMLLCWSLGYWMDRKRIYWRL